MNIPTVKSRKRQWWLGFILLTGITVCAEFTVRLLDYLDSRTTTPSLWYTLLMILLGVGLLVFLPILTYQFCHSVLTRLSSEKPTEQTTDAHKLTKDTAA